MRERVYGIVKYDPGQIEVVPLTEDLLMQLEEEATFALSGRGGCDLENMQTSCFAIEGCASSATPSRLTLRGLLNDATHALVAIARTPEGRPRFVGCVGLGVVHAGQRLFSFPTTCRDGHYMFRLCVAEAFRRHGVGRLLLDAVKRIATRIYLVVAQEATVDRVRPHLEKRAERLRHMYSQYMGFRTVCDSSFGALMCRET